METVFFLIKTKIKGNLFYKDPKNNIYIYIYIQESGQRSILVWGLSALNNNP